MEIEKILPTDGHGRQITPTDVAQFIRLDQCQRYLRLRLFQRNGGAGFMREYGVVPQSIPPLLTRSGERFERRVESAVAQRFWKINFVEDMAHAGQRPEDNERVADLARNLLPGEIVFLFQPRLAVQLGEWRLRGDVDILRMERDEDGDLHLLIADMKSSTSAKVEHRLQVAFYHEMLAELFRQAGIDHREIDMAILFRGPAEGSTAPNEEDAGRREEQLAAAERYFGERVGLLEIVEAPESYRGSVRELVTDPQSTAARIAEAEFEDVPYILGYKCDGCLFNEYCMKSSAEEDDLSLLPHITGEDKAALQRAGIRTAAELAHLKELRNGKAAPAHHGELVPAPGKEPVVRKLAMTWPVGPRLDELVIRARSYRRFKGDQLDSLSYIPSKGYSSLPYCDESHNPNLVRVYIDAQHDYLHDRIYMLGSLVVACEGGREARRRSIVHLTDGPPDTPERERELFLRWVEETVQAIVELAAPDEEGRPRAPIHLIFYNRFEQRLLLDGLARHFDTILAATPLYDFVTQLAAFDSPVATFLDAEIRELKNYPMVCQSLQAVAAFLKFDWNRPQPYRELFRTRMFDFWGKLDEPPREENPWYTSRARFNSQIPLEYAYAAWQDLPDPVPSRQDDFASYRTTTPDLLRGFHARRLEAMERIAQDFAGNKQTEKSSFDLPNLATFEQKAATLAQALDEFVTIERHVALADWKTTRLAPPERRALSGITLLARYREEDQDAEVAARNRENLSRYRLAKYYKEHPPAADVPSPSTASDVARTSASAAAAVMDRKAETKWSQKGMRVRLRLDCEGIDTGLDEILGLTTLRTGDRLVVMPRTTVDSRLPKDDQTPFTPTTKQMLYGPRAELLEISVERDASGRAISAHVEIEMSGPTGKASRGFAFSGIDRPFEDGECYTLDESPDDWYGSFCAKVTEGLIAGEPHPLIPLTGRSVANLAPQRGAKKFLAGLDALHHIGAMHDFEPSKREYIGCHQDTRTLLVQGPPGTGKSYSTAFALFARLQAALEEDCGFRAFLTCKTHAATDVLLANVVKVQEQLRAIRQEHPEIFDRYFDPRLLEIPLFRVNPKEGAPEGSIPLHKKGQRPEGQQETVKTILAQRYCMVGVTPGGTYRMLKDRFNTLFGHELCDCLVLDEASQMNLPEAMMAALPLKQDGQVIVVGDHRQMPPIVKHDWSREPRRTFQEFRAYESLFLSLLPLQPPMIKFEESFRLHADMAEFLRREIYVHDGIKFHSRQHRRLESQVHADPFVAGVLSPDHPIVVVVHDEAESLMNNRFERDLIAPVLEALAGQPYHLDPEHGLGVVVPHRAQRAALQEAVPILTIVDPDTGAILRSAVDTVERFQGDEREAIMVSATESDPQYLLLSGEFLLDPRRLTVALSRAKRKMVLVASRSVFNLFSADEETFANSQLWKNLLRSTCTVKLWEGDREGRQVQVWGNAQTIP